MTGTPYADSYDIVDLAMYNQATTYMGHTPYGWGRYFNYPANTGTGAPYYNPATENSFFSSHSLRLVPIARQEANIALDDYTTGYSDAQRNLTAVLQALGNNATTPFFAANGEHYCSFALDCESTSGGELPMFTNYLHGWLEGMQTGVNDPNNNLLVGWSGVYSSQGYCTTWQSIVNCASDFGIRPSWIWIASGISQTALPAWDTTYTSTEVSCGIALGQSTDLWQYGENEPGSIDLDVGNPNIDFHTALGQYCPIPNP
ncbi:MAG: hypothetical protein HKL85_05840 [Acidimicrobiaceae bacterium]|nr:hypothetical protein [Acidimicrobiaceae bacterium]